MSTADPILKLFERQAADIKAAKLARLRKDQPKPARGATKNPSRLLGAPGGGRAANPGSNRDGRSASSSKPGSPQKSKSVASPFAHLMHASFETDTDFSATPAPAAPPRMTRAARAILSAAEKARTPTSAPAATGVAAKIIAAGKRARGEA
jgi:hypothetical protein